MRRLSRGLAPLVLVGLAACAQLGPRPDLPVETAIPAAGGSKVDRLIAPAEARHPGESAFRLLNEGPEAFVVRAHSAKLAGRSLDVQTYIWHGDLTGGDRGLDRQIGPRLELGAGGEPGQDERRQAAAQSAHVGAPLLRCPSCGADDHGVGELVVPALLARVERNPDEAEHQRQH